MAVDFGKRGTSFAIKEEGFLAMIKRKLEKIDIEEENKKMQAIAKERVNNPTPVEGITAATKNREFYWDPTYELKEDAILPCGKILHPAGARVNPLDHMDFERVLLFVDARKPDQLRWLEQELTNYAKEDGEDSTKEKSNKFEARVILVGGSVFNAQEELGRTVYFDQSGELSTKFGIKAVPARVEQKGKLLKITELVIVD
jgi:conjugal transfer pilus assembly protein TraW